jgi:colicin import membrane protein
MSNQGSSNKTQARTRAQEQFAKVTQRDTEVRKEREKEQNATATKIAKLRALRLAKEAEDKKIADAEALANPPKKKAVKKVAVKAK